MITFKKTRNGEIAIEGYTFPYRLAFGRFGFEYRKRLKAWYIPSSMLGTDGKVTDPTAAAYLRGIHDRQTAKLADAKAVKAANMERLRAFQAEERRETAEYRQMMFGTFSK